MASDPNNLYSIGSIRPVTTEDQKILNETEIQRKNRILSARIINNGDDAVLAAMKAISISRQWKRTREKNTVQLSLRW